MMERERVVKSTASPLERPTGNPRDPIGLRFGRLVVYERAGSMGRPGQWRGRWICICDCGEWTTVETSNLRSGNTRSCGCLRREVCEQRGNLDA